MSSAILERINLITKLSDCNRILDLGCGDGAYITHLKEKASEVIGLDLEPTKLENTKKYVQVIRADASNLPFIDNSFEIVWASEIIEHTPSLDTFEEIERIAKSKIIATVPNPKGPYIGKDPSHILQYDLSTLREFLRERDWKYNINGLGLCLPSGFFPKIFRRIFVRLTWNHPEFSFNFLITGVLETHNPS